MFQVPEPVITVDDFVGEAAAVQILQYAIDNESAFRPSKIVLGHAAVVDESRRVSRVNSAIGALIPLIEPVIRENVDNAIPKLGLVNIDSYYLEPELTWCGDGSFFSTHSDTLVRDRLANQRVLTMIYYFYRRPKAFTGGQLRLYGLGRQANHCTAEIEPRFDRAVLFPSWFPHEVLPVQCSSGAFSDGRFAISCWVRKNSATG